MPNLVHKPQAVVKTKNGECTIRLVVDLNINLNDNGLSISANRVEASKQEDDETAWVVPDFSNEEKIDFGKQVKGE